MFIGTCLFSCALFSCGENSVLEEVDNSGDAPQTKSCPLLCSRRWFALF